MSERLVLFRGPLHRFGCRGGLVRDGTDAVALGLAIGLGLWTVLAALAWIENGLDRVFSLAEIGGHVRLLVAIPLLFVGESLFGERPAHFLRTIVESRIVAPQDVPILDAEVARIDRLADSWKAEAACLLLAALFPLIAHRMSLPGTTASFQNRALADGTIALTGLWYWFVCMTAFRFLLLRWAWRLALWAHLLWRVSRLPLRLTPTHPDGFGGIGYLEVVHAQFAPLAMALSAILAAAMAEGLATGTRSFESVYPNLLIILAAHLVLFVGPLALFAGQLYECREKGIVDYTVFVALHLKHFEHEFVRPGADPATQPLADGDVQSLADLTNVMNGVHRMGLVPAGAPLLTALTLATLLPFLPLALLRFPIAELSARLVQMLFGLR